MRNPVTGFDPATRGLLVLRVDRQSPMNGELQLYDLIEEVARKPVATIQELESELASARDRQSILLTVKRRANGRTLSEVVLFRRTLEGDGE